MSVWLLYADYNHIMSRLEFSGAEGPSKEGYEESSTRATLHFEAKGYHECHFSVSNGDQFESRRKIGEKGRAFGVLSDDGRLGHLQKELVPILWNLDRSVVLKW